MSGEDVVIVRTDVFIATVVLAAVVAVGLWELAQWVFRHLRVEWIA